MNNERHLRGTIQSMPNRMPNRFDVIYAHGINDKIKDDCIGYVLDIREDERKTKKVINNNGMPAYTPKQYFIKFLNYESMTFGEEVVFDKINKGEWKISTPFPSHFQPGHPKYNIGDLIHNKKNNKVSIIIGIVETGHEEKIDAETRKHSQYWYKVQSPGQRWEPMSETFIDFGVIDEFLQVHERSLVKPKT